MPVMSSGTGQFADALLRAATCHPSGVLTIRLGGVRATAGERVVLRLCEAHVLEASLEIPLGLATVSSAGRRTTKEVPPKNAYSEQRDVQRVLVRTLMVGSGTFEAEVARLGLDPTINLEGKRLLKAHLEEAAALVLSIQDALRPVGGLDVVVGLNVERLVQVLSELPDGVRQVAQLVDDIRTAAEILRDAPTDELTTARILARLSTLGVVQALTSGSLDLQEQTETPFSSGRSVAEEANHGDHANDFDDAADAGHAADAQALTLGSIEDKAKEFARKAESVKPVTPKEPEAREELEEPEEPEAPGEFEDIEDAGREFRAPFTQRWIIGLAAIVLTGVVFVLWQAGREAGQRDMASGSVRPVDPPTGLSTSAQALDTAREFGRVESDSAGERPPVAGPDAPADIRAAETMLREGRYDLAEKALIALKSTRPRDPSVLVLLGLVYVDTGRLQAAQQSAEQALEIDSTFFRAWVLKGTALQFRWRLRDAMEAYKQALAINPEHPISEELRSVIEDLERKTR